MKHYLAFVLFFFLKFLVYSQSRVDSLTAIVESDTLILEKLKACKKLAPLFIKTQPSKAENYIQKGIVFADSLDDAESSLYFELQRARLFLATNKVPEALSLGKQLILKSESLDAKKLNGKSHLLVGSAYSRIKQDSSAAFHYRLAINVFDLTKNHSDKGGAYMNLAIDARKNNNIKNALGYYNKAFTSFEQANDIRMQSNVSIALGSIYSMQGYHEKAIFFFEKSLNLSKMINDELGMAFAYNRIGGVLETTKKFARSMINFQKALAIFQKLDRKLNCANVYNNLGNVYKELRDFGKATTYYKKGLTLYQQIGNESDIGTIYYNIATVLLEKKQYDQALSYLTKSLEIAERLNEKREVAMRLNLLGVVHSSKKEYELAISYYEKSMVINNELEDNLGNVFALMNIARIYLEGLNDEAKAFEYYDQVFAICKEMNFIQWQRMLLNDIGNHYTSKGNLPKALQFYTDALKLVEEVKDTIGMANINNSLANIYEIQENYATSFRHRKRALNYLKKLDHKSEIARTKNTIASLFSKINQPDSSLIYARDALKSYKTLQDSCGFDSAYLNIGKAHSFKTQIDSAFFYLHASIKQARKCKKGYVLAQAYTELGKIYAEEGQKNRAFQYYEKAFSHAQSSKDNVLIKESALHLHPIYKERNQYKKAYEVLNIYQASKDSLFNQENTRVLIQREMEAAYAKKEQERLLTQQREDTLQERRLERQKLFIYMFIVGFLAMLMIALAFYRNYRNKLNSNILLRQQKKELEELDLAKSRLFANISHELRTPLTLISSPVERLINNGKSSDTELLDTLDLVKRNSQQLQDLVDDILNLSKLESNQIELNEEPTELKPFLSRVFSNFESLTMHMQIQYHINLERLENIWTLLDVGKVEKVLNNLLSNAIKHTPSGGKVSLKVSVEEKNLKLEVSDTGSGIPASDLPQIFDRFFQSKQPDAPLQGGTGIGLALTKELVQIMKGHIVVTSEVGKGSLFLVTLPYQKTEALPSTSLLEQEVKEEIDLKHLSPTDIPEEEKKFHVLIVEDHRDMQRFVNELLSKKYYTHLANQGNQALKVLKKTKIDLIISDLMMPEMDGFALLEKLKNAKEYAHIPIIMLTALDTQESKLSALTLGVDDYLTKPFSPKELFARAHNLLERHESRQHANEIVQENLTAGKLEEVALYPENLEDTPIIEQETGLQWLKRVADIMREELENPNFKMADIASQFYMSERHFHRRVKQLTGMPPKKYQREVALQKARYLLERKLYGNITAVCYAVGISNISRFSQLYEARFGKRPKEYFSLKAY